MTIFYNSAAEIAAELARMKEEEDQAKLQFDLEQAEKRGHNEQQRRTDHASSSEVINYSEADHNDEIVGEEYGEDEDEHVVRIFLFF